MRVGGKRFLAKACWRLVFICLLGAVGVLVQGAHPPRALADTLAQQAFTACGSAATISDCDQGYIDGYNGKAMPKNADGFYKGGYTKGVAAKGASSGGGKTTGDTKPPANVPQAVTQKGFSYCKNSFSGDVGNCTAGYEWGYTGGSKPSPCNSFCNGGYAQGATELGQVRSNPPAGCPSGASGTDLAACQAGASAAASGTSESTACASYGGSALAACKAAFEASPGDPNAPDTCNSNAVSLGWFLCPAINLATSTIHDIVQQVIIPELQVKPLDGSSGEYGIWKNIRTLADVIFVLAFLGIIFANVANFEVETYTIKKMLPRLVAAVVLVQFSFILSAVIVDIGNILGNGIQGLINSTVINNFAHSASGSSSGGSVLYTLGSALDAGLVIGVVSTIGVPTLLLAVVGGLISAVGVLFTLIARRLIITILVITSPLAFALWVLPNTEKVFKLWLNNFIKISLMYPIIMFILSAAAIGAAAEQNTSGPSKIEGLLGALFPIIAFFMIPMTFKMAGGAMSGATGFISGATGRARGGATSGLDNSKMMENLRRNRAERKETKLNHAIENGGLKGWVAGVRTRGDVLGGKRMTMKGIQDSPEMQRRQMEQELEAAQHKIDTNMPLREQAHKKQIEQKELSAVAALHADDTPEQIYEALERAVARKDTTAVKALGGLASKAGVLDQPEYMGKMLEAFDMSTTDGREAAQGAIQHARAQNFAALQKDNYLLSRFDATKGDTMDANGNVTLGYSIDPKTGKNRAEELIAGMSAERLASQTGKGHSTTYNARVTQANGGVVAAPTLVDQQTKDDIKSSPVLKGKISRGGDLERLVT